MISVASSPIDIEIRAPWTVRLSMSRPSSSVPEDVGAPTAARAARPVAVVDRLERPDEQLRGDGQDREDDEDGEPEDAVARGCTNRPANVRASSTAQAPALGADVRDGGAGASLRSRSRPDPRIEEAVDQVGDEVGHDDGDRQEQEDALEHRVVARRQGVDGQRPEARPVEDDLRRDRAGRRRSRG